MQTKLPKVAVDFLQAHPSRKRKSVLRSFHRWMTHWKIGLKNLKQAHIESFIRCPNGKHISPASQDHYRKYLTRYLIWLHGKDLLCFDPRCFLKNFTPPLPEIAARYIRSLAPTRKNNTLNAHRGALRNFHRWLDLHEVSLDTLQRHHMSAWLEALSNAGHVPATVRRHIILVRLYLWWLYDQGIVSSYPDDLIRPSDVVKEPKYLPRPLPPATDIALQERLAKSDNIYCQGLLLMRKTGLRIGELTSLEKNCLRSDHLGNQFLKVPLGKLDTERLVPLEESTVAIIHKLRGSDEETARKTFLIEIETGKKTDYWNYTAVLKEACKGLETNGKIVSHRLRHTFATSLLAAGMSLVSLMKLLGHNDYRMTLRYAEITQETVTKEYFEAISRLEHRYADLLNNTDESQEPDLFKILNDAVHLIQKLSADDDTTKTTARSIIKRIQRIKADVQKLFHNHP